MWQSLHGFSKSSKPRPMPWLAALCGLISMCCESQRRPLWKIIQTTAVLLVLMLAMLSTTGCINRPVLIPDRTTPHRISREMIVPVVMLQPDGSTVEARMRVDAGWIVVSPEWIDAHGGAE